MNFRTLNGLCASVVVVALLTTGCATSDTAAATNAVVRDFRADVRGRMADHFTPGESDGNGTPAAWQVEDDVTAPVAPGVFVVRTANLEKTYNFATFDGFLARNVEIAVHLKALSGADDQGGGLVWRFQDSKNYYLTRWNPLEKNIRLYVVKDGIRSKFGDCEIDVTPGWHQLSISMQGETIAVSFDGKVVIQGSNSAIAGAGKVGLWTKADATTAFDGFKATPTP